MKSLLLLQVLLMTSMSQAIAGYATVKFGNDTFFDEYPRAKASLIPGGIINESTVFLSKRYPKQTVKTGGGDEPQIKWEILGSLHGSIPECFLSEKQTLENGATYVINIKPDSPCKITITKVQ